MSEALGEFFSNQDEQQKGAYQKSMDGASSEERAKPIAYPGRYLCKATTFAYPEKNTDKMRVVPEVFISSNTKSLNLNINLAVVDGTPQAPVGSGIYANVVLCPNSKDQEAIDKVMRFTKPRLVALTGTDKISLTPEWIEEWLMPKYVQEGKKYTMVKNHKMQQNVMVLVDEEVDKSSGKIRLAVKSISKALPGERSETFPTADQTSNVNVPTGTPAPTMNYGGALATDIGAEASMHPDIGTVEEF